MYANNIQNIDFKNICDKYVEIFNSQDIHISIRDHITNNVLVAFSTLLQSMSKQEDLVDFFRTNHKIDLKAFYKAMFNCSILKEVESWKGFQGGNKNSGRSSAYKKYLENLTVERLRKMAISKGIKVTKKKDGKTVYVKKATMVKNLNMIKK